MTEYNEAIHLAIEREYHPRRHMISKYRRLRRAWLKYGTRRAWARGLEFAGGSKVMKIEYGKVTVARVDLE